MSNRKPTKTCAACGRPFEWRKKWASNWDEVRYCSNRCRGKRSGRTGAALEQAIVELLIGRQGTICPSEAARRVRPDDWRDYMQEARSAGRRLAADGRIVVLQRGKPVDAGSAKGAIRYGRGPAFPS